MTVFWAALGQVFWGSSYRAALQEIQQARIEEGLEALSASTSSYCTAKKERMDEADLKAILVKLGKDLADQDRMLWTGQAWRLQTHTPTSRNTLSRANRKAVAAFL